MKSAGDYLSLHTRITYSIITHFEILRGLRAKDAKLQITKFNQISKISDESKPNAANY